MEYLKYLLLILAVFATRNIISSAYAKKDCESKNDNPTTPKFKDCNWTTIPDNILEQHPDMEELHVEGNNLTTVKFDQFADYEKLKSLDMSSNNIKTIAPIHHSKKLKHITSLSLRNNDLVNITELCKLSKISILNLGNNQNLDFKSAHFICWKDLDYLGLESTNLIRLGNDYSLFAGMSQLRALTFRNNNMGHFCVGSFPTLSNLISFSVSGNDLEMLDISELKRKFPKLNEIYLLDNSWSCAYFDHLTTTLRHMNISVEGQCNSSIPEDKLSRPYNCDIKIKNLETAVDFWNISIVGYLLIIVDIWISFLYYFDV